MAASEKGRGVSLRVRMTLVFAGSLAVLLVVLCVGIVTQIQDIVIPLTQDLGRQVVEARSAEVARWIEGRLAIVQNMASLPVLASGDTDAIHALIDSRKGVNSDFEEEVYVRQDGWAYGSNGTDTPITERQYYQVIIGQGAATFTSDGTISRGSGDTIIIVAAAIRDQSGANVGIYYGSVTLARLSETVQQAGIGEGGYGWIADGRGLVIAHPNTDYRLKLNLSDAAAAGFVGLDTVAQSKEQGGGLARVTTPEGAVEVVMYHPIPSTSGWVFALSVPEAQITQGSGRLVTGTVVISAAILMLAILISIFYSGRIARPTSFLADKAARFARGDLSLEESERAQLARAAVRRDEIGLMAGAFGDMATYLENTVVVAQAIARGDLSVDVAVRAENDRLGAAHQEMVRSLGELLSVVRASVEQVTGGSEQIAQASQGLSQGAAEQASALEEISASLTEIDTQSRGNARSAAKANELAREASLGAHTGKTGMDELKTSIQRVNEQSGRIGSVVKVIDDIAFQINLLALNANVEAARAGKYGKGFAVVADEVRRLAVRSAQAVKETTGMVEEAIRAIESSTRSTESAAAQLDQIVRASTGVADILSEIAAASREQADKVAQVTAGLDQVDQVTQSNTSSSEETAAASQELASQARHLEELVSRFKLGAASSSLKLTGTPDTDHADLPAEGDSSASTQR